MKRRLKLKDNVKVTLLIIATITIFLVAMHYHSERIEKINNGEITVQKHNAN